MKHRSTQLDRRQTPDSLRVHGSRTVVNSSAGVEEGSDSKVRYEACSPPRMRVFELPPSHMESAVGIVLCQFQLKIPRCTGRKFPTPALHEWASLAADGVEPSAAFWRVLGVTESEAKERAAASAPSCPRGGTRPALRRSFSRYLSPRLLLVVE